MSEVILKDIVKIYPYIDKPQKGKKGAADAFGGHKVRNLQITDKGVVAVQQFNLNIADGEFVVLVGPSGCGKSTTLRMVAGLEEISEGELFIDGNLVNSIEPKDRDIAMVFQSYALYPHMTVYNNMAYPLRIMKQNITYQFVIECITRAINILKVKKDAALAKNNTAMAEKIDLKISNHELFNALVEVKNSRLQLLLEKHEADLEKLKAVEESGTAILKEKINAGPTQKELDIYAAKCAKNKVALENNYKKYEANLNKLKAVEENGIAELKERINADQSNEKYQRKLDIFVAKCAKRRVILENKYKRNEAGLKEKINADNPAVKNQRKLDIFVAKCTRRKFALENNYKKRVEITRIVSLKKMMKVSLEDSIDECQNYIDAGILSYFGKMTRFMIDCKVLQTADMLNITEYLQRKPKNLSGGQRQRVAIGRACVRNPKVLLMDEPLSNLDAKLRNEMRAELIKLRSKIQTTFIYVTHDQTEAMTLGDRIVVMRDGFIQQIGTPQEVYDHPKNKFVSGFIGTPQMNYFDAKLIKENGKYFVEAENYKVELSEEKQERLRNQSVESQDIVLGVRPDHIFLADDGVSGTVEVSELMGPTCHLHMTIMNKDAIVIVPTNGQYVNYVGQTLKLAFNGNVVHMFSLLDEHNLEFEPQLDSVAKANELYEINNAQASETNAIDEQLVK